MATRPPEPDIPPVDPAEPDPPPLPDPVIARRRRAARRYAANDNQ